MLKIYDSPSPSLCDTCRNVSRARGDYANELIMECSEFSETPRFPVKSCSLYADANKPTLNDMRGTAWILETDQRTKKFGFLPNAAWRSKHKREAVLDTQNDERY